jgi:hypothetical protein
MSEHKFKIGQRLFPTRSVGLNVPEGAYVVVKRFPERDGEFEYQVKNVSESDERVVRESQLRPDRPPRRGRQSARENGAYNPNSAFGGDSLRTHISDNRNCDGD